MVFFLTIDFVLPFFPEVFLVLSVSVCMVHSFPSFTTSIQVTENATCARTYKCTPTPKDGRYTFFFVNVANHLGLYGVITQEDNNGNFRSREDLMSYIGCPDSSLCFKHV